MMLGDPVSELTCVPGALPRCKFSADRLEHGRGQRGLFPTPRFVGQGIKAPSEKGFDPATDSLFMRAKMLGNLGDTPAGIGEPHHLQPIASACGNSRLTSAVLQFESLYIR